MFNMGNVAERSAPGLAGGAWERDPEYVLLSMTQALDKLGHGVALLEGEGVLVFANAAARGILGDSPAWSLAGDRLACRDEALRERWLKALAAAHAKGVRAMIEFDGRAGPVHAAVIPMAPGAPRVLLVLGKIETCGVLEERMFAARYGLTATETDVLHLLCQGLATNDIALAHGVAPSTIMTQITSIRAKTGTSSVRALLHAVARLPPLRSALAGN